MCVDGLGWQMIEQMTGSFVKGDQTVENILFPFKVRGYWTSALCDNPDLMRETVKSEVSF